MAYTTLKDDYQNDVLNTVVNTNVKYIMVDNGDGTISLQDATSYTTMGDAFGASDINATNDVVNTIGTDLTVLKTTAVTRDGSGNVSIGSGNFSTTGSASSGSISTTGNASIGGSATVTGNASIGGNTTVTGNATISGGATVTGNCTTRGTFINRFNDINSASAPVSDLNKTVAGQYDTNGKMIGISTIRNETSGLLGHRFGVCREISGTQTYNLIGCDMDKYGNRSYFIHDAGAFREALGLSSLFKLTSHTPSGYSFTANQYRKLTTTITRPSGYSGVITSFVCTSSSSADVFNYYINGSTLTWEVINRSSSSLSNVDFSCTILWIKDGYFA